MSDIKLDDYRLAQAGLISHNSIKELAVQKYNELCHFDPELEEKPDPYRVAKAIESHGGKLHFEEWYELGQNWDHSLLTEGDGSFDIFLPPQKTKASANFGLARLFGHYLLHTDKGQRFRVPWLLEDDCHKNMLLQANLFASYFLLPPVLLKNAVKIVCGDKNKKVSAIIGDYATMSEKAVEFRMSF